MSLHLDDIEPNYLYDDYLRFISDSPAKEIKRMRLNNNLTQQKFGEQIGVSRKTVLRWEKGKAIILGIVLKK